MNALPLITITNVAAYGCGTYGSGVYDGACVTGSTPGGSTPGTNNPIGGNLADTGWNILIPVFLGLAIIFSAVIYMIRQHRHTGRNR